MSNYKKLLVWQETLVLIDEVYDIAMVLPDYETFALSNQLRRAVVSIASNIAEGAGRGTLKDYIHFLYNAKGSAYEVETQLIICARRRFISEGAANHIILVLHAFCGIKIITYKLALKKSIIYSKM